MAQRERRKKGGRGCFLRSAVAFKQNKWEAKKWEKREKSKIGAVLFCLAGVEKMKVSVAKLHFPTERDKRSWRGVVAREETPQEAGGRVGGGGGGLICIQKPSAS